MMVGWWNNKPPRNTRVNSRSLLLVRNPNFIHVWLWNLVCPPFAAVTSVVIIVKIFAENLTNGMFSYGFCNLWMDNGSVHLSLQFTAQLLGGRWWVGPSFPVISGYFQCLPNAGCSGFQSTPNWSADLQYRRRDAGAFPWYHWFISVLVFSCCFCRPPQVVLSWPSFFSCSRPHTPAAHPSQSTHQPAQLIHPLWDTGITFCRFSQPVPPVLPSLGSPVSVDLQPCESIPCLFFSRPSQASLLLTRSLTHVLSQRMRCEFCYQLLSKVQKP